MNTRARVTKLIEDFMSDPKNNHIAPNSDSPAFDTPLVGFCRGDDPLFEEFKQHIGPFYWTPLEILQIEYPETEFSPQNLSVITWILPQTKATRDEQRKCRELPGRLWSQNRYYGEAANHFLREHVQAWLRESGIAAISPLLSPHWGVVQSETCGIASNWSERHAAHASGLGTFGLCDGLITPKGKAVRIGSVVAAVDIEPTPRPYSDLHAYCLFYSTGTCVSCINRCPAGAISESGHDKQKCMNYIRKVTAPYVKKELGVEVTPCGLCQVGVPCESKIPVKR